MQTFTETRDGADLRVMDDGGAGPAVLLLHGLAGPPWEWEAVARLLRHRFRVVAFD